MANHTYNNGQPYRLARGRYANVRPVEYRSGNHPILSGRPSTEEFLAAVKREMKIRFYKQASISNYLSILNKFLAWLGQPPHRATIENVRCFLELMVDVGSSPSHLSVSLSAIRTAFDKFCGRDITLGLVTPRKKKTQPVIL